MLRSLWARQPFGTKIVLAVGAALAALILLIGGITAIMSGNNQPTTVFTQLSDSPSPSPTPEKTQSPSPSPSPSPIPATSPPAPAVTTEAPPPPAQDVYYPNCAAARAAGAAPLHRGDPGYRSGLDRDGDGIACERR